MRVHLFFPEAGSLKGKRAELNRVKALLRERLHVSVAEVGHQDSWQRSTLAVAIAAGSAAGAEEAADTVQRSRDEVLRAIREADRFCLTTHERPDGDAVGSLAAMQQVLATLGKDAVAFLPADQFPLPYEYRFIKLEGLATEPPEDLCSRTLVFLDCGNIDRTPAEVLKRDGAAPIINIDHHHDNTRFGTINHVVETASCTAEIVWDLMSGLDVEATQD